MQSAHPMNRSLLGDDETVENNFELGRLYRDISNTLFLNHPTQADLEGLEARWAQLRDQEPAESARSTTDDCLSALRTRVQMATVSNQPETLF